MIRAEGLNEAIASLERLKAAMIAEPRKEVYETLEKTATTAKQLVPVETGTLRSTIHTEMMEGASGAIGAGGPAAPYAEVVHEDTSMNHPHGGQAKFIEEPFMQETQGIGERVRSRITRAAGL